MVLRMLGIGRVETKAILPSGISSRPLSVAMIAGLFLERLDRKLLLET